MVPQIEICGSHKSVSDKISQITADGNNDADYIEPVEICFSSQAIHFVELKVTRFDQRLLLTLVFFIFSRHTFMTRPW
jgi:hypothetical protein